MVARGVCECCGTPRRVSEAIKRLRTYADTFPSDTPPVGRPSEPTPAPRPIPPPTPADDRPF